MTEREIYSNKSGEILLQNNQNLNEYDGISLKDMMLSLWEYRRIIAILILAATLLIGGTGVLIFMFQNKESTTRLQFRLDFDGVEKNEYPNGTKFSTADILVSPVLVSVFNSNDLKRYLNLEDFRASLAVIQTNDKVRLLEYEYAPKLEDKRLTVEQRSRLEAEFLEKKKNIMVPVFNILLSGNKSLESIPSNFRVKVLNDILSNWAEYAERVKGVNKFQIPLVSQKILTKEDLDNQDYLVGVDMLRNTTERILRDIEKLQKIPGAANFRLQENGVSLQDLKYRILDMDKFKISPILGVIRLGGITKDDKVTRVYLQHRIFELKIREEDATSREKIYEASFNNYGQGIRTTLAEVDAGQRYQPSNAQSSSGLPTTINQLGESFLSSIIKMSQENLDAKFRQELTEKIILEGLAKVQIVSDLKYYERLFSELSIPEEKNQQIEAKDQIRTIVIASVDQIHNALIRTIGELNDIYLNLSMANLNPSSTLFTVTEPAFTYNERGLNLKKVVSYIAVIWVLAVGCILVGILIFNSFQKKRDHMPS